MGWPFCFAETGPSRRTQVCRVWPPGTDEAGQHSGAGNNRRQSPEEGRDMIGQADSNIRTIEDNSTRSVGVFPRSGRQGCRQDD